MSEAVKEMLANEMADAATYYFKIQESAPKEPDAEYWRVRVRAKQLLWTAVQDWKKYLKRNS